MKNSFRYLFLALCIMGLSSQVNAYTITFKNTTPNDIKFYELTCPASQATYSNFFNYFTPGVTPKTVADGSTYTFSTNANTDSIYMVVVGIAPSQLIPIKFNVNSTNSGTLTITRTLTNSSIIFTIKKGSKTIVSVTYNRNLL